MLLKPQDSFKYQRSADGGGKGDVSPLELIKDQNGARFIITYGESLLSVCVCEKGSQFCKWAGGLIVKRSVLREDRFGPTADTKSAQRRDLRPAVTQAGEGGAFRTVQSEESVVTYVGAVLRLRCGRCGLRGSRF